MPSKTVILIKCLLPLSLLLAIGLSAQQSPSSSATSQAPANSDAKVQGPTAGQPSQDVAPAAERPPVDMRTEDAYDAKTGLPRYKTIVEDWSNLPIGKSELHPEPPLVAQTEDLGAVTRTLVRLKWRPGDPIDLYVILPKDVKNPPAVLYLYGHDEDTYRFKDDRWCGRVTGGGVAAVGFVSALTGHRFHDRPLQQWFVSELQESLGSTVHDVKFILDYLASRGDIDMSRIGMFGQGSGGTIAILAAAADPRIKVIDLLGPWGYWPVWLSKSSVLQDDPKRADYLKPQFLEKVAPLDPVKWLPTLKSQRIRLQQPLNADDVPLACMNRIKAALPRTKTAELVRFKTTAELFNKEGGGYLFQWIKTQVKDLPASQESSPAVKTAEATGVAAQPEKPQPRRQ